MPDDFDFCARLRSRERDELRLARRRWWLVMLAIAAATALMLLVSH